MADADCPVRVKAHCRRKPRRRNKPSSSEGGKTAKPKAQKKRVQPTLVAAAPSSGGGGGNLTNVPTIPPRGTLGQVGRGYEAYQRRVDAMLRRERLGEKIRRFARRR